MVKTFHTLPYFLPLTSVLYGFKCTINNHHAYAVLLFQQQVHVSVGTWNTDVCLIHQEKSVRFDLKHLQCTKSQ